MPDSPWYTISPSPRVSQEVWHDVLDHLELVAADIWPATPPAQRGERVIATISGPDGQPIEVVLR